MTKENPLEIPEVSTGIDQEQVEKLSDSVEFFDLVDLCAHIGELGLKDISQVHELINELASFFIKE